MTDAELTRIRFQAPARLALRAAALSQALSDGDRQLAGRITRQTLDDHGPEAVLRILCAHYCPTRNDTT